jgi:predicted acylesterase/phospholipase RssA
VGAHQIFDFFAGTSTGALLALGLVKPNPLSPGEIIQVYRDWAATIFPPARFTGFGAMRQAISNKYEAGPWEEVLHDLFGDERLSECIANVIVAAYDTDNRGPFFFKHFDPEPRRRRGEPPDFYLRDVARATSAAPTFFPPARITSFDGRYITLVDGGIVANNPALSAYVEARKCYPDARSFLILSLGTGRSGRTYSYDQLRRWGYIDWVSPGRGVPMMSMVSDGQSQSVAHALARLPGIEYYRYNFDLDDTTEEMDDASPENLERLDAIACQLIRFHSRELHLLARRLYARRIRPLQRIGTAISGR